MYDTEKHELQELKDMRHPWASPGTAPVFGNGCGANGGNPNGCDCQENGSNDCYGDDTRAYGSCCGKVGRAFTRKAWEARRLPLNKILKLIPVTRGVWRIHKG